MFNDFLLATFIYNSKENSIKLNDLSAFVYVKIDGLKFIYIFEEEIYIVPTKTN